MTGILFDLDGTLLDTLEDLYNATNHTLRHYGCPERSMKEVREFVGNGARVLIEKALPGLPTDPCVDEALAFYQKYYNQNCNDGSTGPYPGVLEALEILGKKYPMAIVSNKPDPAVKALCAKFFPGIYALGVTDDCPRKPAADMLQKAMKIIGADRCVYVGDSEVDVLTAKNAACPCLSVTWGFRDEDVLKEAGATHFCHSADTLISAIEQIL
jgi:phosphoglycolate phosphatase